MTLAGRVDAEAQRIAQGLRLKDVALIHELVERYQLRLVRYLIYYSGRREHVEDLVQETWLRVLEHGNRYRDFHRKILGAGEKAAQLNRTSSRGHD